jgi:DNA mismatch endonuclease, patch repair protein
MPDKFSKEKRSEIMSRINSKNTKAEIIVFRELRKRGIYFQKHYKRIEGNPDIALPRKKKAIFIDGDFWHGYDYEKLINRLPKEYWKEKIIRNVERDKKYTLSLKNKGWQVLRVWEHEVKKNFDNTIEKIITFLKYS